MVGLDGQPEHAQTGPATDSSSTTLLNMCTYSISKTRLITRNGKHWTKIALFLKYIIL